MRVEAIEQSGCWCSGFLANLGNRAKIESAELSRPFCSLFLVDITRRTKCEQSSESARNNPST